MNARPPWPEAAYPNTARAGFFWWEWDPVYYFLKLLEEMGVVWNLREAPEKVKFNFARG